MAGAKSIDTGVDKLVRIVAKEKKIELETAARQLGVEPTVVQEWADFLEQEGIVELQYSLSKTFIIEKRLSSAEVEKKGKEYEYKKEAFTRKVDSTLRQLEQETTDFESIKKQYYTLKGQIGDEIDAVKDEIDQLHHYEQLKKSIDSDILKQKVEYQNTLADIHLRITSEERRYNKIIEEIRGEQAAITQERTEFNDIKHEENDLFKRIDALQDILKSVVARVGSQQENAKLHEERLDRLRDLATTLQKDLTEKKTKEIDPLLKISTAQEQRIQRIQDEIMQKVKTRRSQMQQVSEQSEEIMQRFEQFFTKRAHTEETIKELEKAKFEMKEELNDLIRKAKAFDLTVKGADANAHVKELEMKFKDFDKKRGVFVGKMERLKNIIMGKDVLDEEPRLAKAPAKSVPSVKPTAKKEITVVKPAAKKEKEAAKTTAKKKR